MANQVKYIKTNHSPVGIFCHPNAYAAINAVVCVTAKTWQEVTKSLIEQAHQRADLPQASTCITDMLRANGFKRSGKMMWGSFIDNLKQDKDYIIKPPYSGYISVVKRAGNQIYARGFARDDYYLERHRTVEVWEYLPGTDNRTGLSRPQKYTRQLPETPELHGVNVNPKGKFIGDCAIRGLSSAVGCSWHEAVDLLAETADYNEPVLNKTSNINATLERLGFEYFKTSPDSSGKSPLGAAFCRSLPQLYPDGANIYAFFGDSHCAAILPERQADGSISYRLQDTWDSSARAITCYWVKRNRPQTEIRQTKSLSQVIPKPEKPKPQTHIEIDNTFRLNSSVMHPTYGYGVIVNINISSSGNKLEINFGENGVRIISEKWLKNQSA